MNLKYLCAIFVIGITIVFMTFGIFGKENEEALCRDFLMKYGWETENEASEIEEITIPNEFDEVYKNYNELQREAKLDLLPYCGESGRRYTYIVTNYPLDVGETVYADVICIGGKPVAGDIMTVSMSGFMHSLAEK